MVAAIYLQMSVRILSRHPNPDAGPAPETRPIMATELFESVVVQNKLTPQFLLMSNHNLCCCFIPPTVFKKQIDEYLLRELPVYFK